MAGEEKKCHYCAMMIPKEAKICPHCRKKTPMSAFGFLAGAIGFLIIWVIFLKPPTIPSTPSSNDINLPSKSVFTIKGQPDTSYKVLWKQGIILGLLLSENKSQAQLKDLIYKFKQAKNDQTLSTMIPPVNLGLKDKYTNFIIFIFSDPKWATVEAYKKYEQSGMESVTARAYLNHIVASYLYDFDDKEYGSLGHDDGVSKSRNYRKLF